MNRGLSMVLMVIGVVLIVVGVLQHYALKIPMLHLATIAAGVGAVVFIIGIVGAAMSRQRA